MPHIFAPNMTLPPDDVGRLNTGVARWSRTVGESLFCFAVPIYADGPRHECQRQCHRALGALPLATP